MKKRFVLGVLYLRAAAGLLALVSAGTGCCSSVFLSDVNSADPASSQQFRWRDVTGTAYAPDYVHSYNYTQAHVYVQYDRTGPTFKGELVAKNLKPNFAYQLKLAAAPGNATVPALGAAGRYWQEEWENGQWANGWNLNDKGAGYSPSPNDLVYRATRGLADSSSPTGLRYRYSTYVLFDYFLTDANGNATVNFELNSSYHVLWRPDQCSRTSLDGPEKVSTVVVRASSPAYDRSLPDTTAAVFGEWERLPPGGIRLAPGLYTCELLLTEESFHEVGDGDGFWAVAMEAPVAFDIGQPPTFAQQPQPLLVKPGALAILHVGVNPSPGLALQWFHDDTPVAGATGTDLVLASATAADEGVYRCVATNTFGQTKSRAVSLWVRDDLYTQADLDQAIARAAADSDGNGTASFDYSLTLQPGWNLISLARMPQDNSLAGIFGADFHYVDGPAWIWVNGRYQPTDYLEPEIGQWIHWDGPPRRIEIRLP